LALFEKSASKTLLAGVGTFILKNRHILKRKRREVKERQSQDGEKQRKDTPHSFSLLCILLLCGVFDFSEKRYKIFARGVVLSSKI